MNEEMLLELLKTELLIEEAKIFGRRVIACELIPEKDIRALVLQKAAADFAVVLAKNLTTKYNEKLLALYKNP